MADVRLTATNPEDSSVVPVACNEKGELKLEEIPDQSFDGNLDGDLTVTGSATFDGNVTAGKYNSGDSSSGAVVVKSTGQIVVQSQAGSQESPKVAIQGYETSNTGSMKGSWSINSDGSASFPGEVAVGGEIVLTEGLTTYKLPTIGNGGQFGYDDTTKSLRLYSNSSTNNFASIEFYHNKSATPDVTFSQGGAATFAGNKAGFTAEGYLWCTTRRGDTVILDATSNGLASWLEYSPPTLREEIKDAWSEKNAIDTTDVKFPSDPPEKPADTQ